MNSEVALLFSIQSAAFLWLCVVLSRHSKRLDRERDALWSALDAHGRAQQALLAATEHALQDITQTLGEFEAAHDKPVRPAPRCDCRDCRAQRAQGPN